MFQKIKEYAFKGLLPSYYFRQLFVSVWLPGALLYIFGNKMLETGFSIEHLPNLIFPIIFWVLYPYSRFVYEVIMEFIFGETVFLVNIVLLFLVKFITMTACYVFSPIIAPIGLVFLYFYNAKAAKKMEQQLEDNE